MYDNGVPTSSYVIEILPGHKVEMLRAGVTERRYDAFIGVVELEAAFLNDALRFGVAVIVPAPHGLKMQFSEASRK